VLHIRAGVSVRSAELPLITNSPTTDELERAGHRFTERLRLDNLLPAALVNVTV
jgi:hypothetical protein